MRLDLGLPWTGQTGYRQPVPATAHQGYLFSYTLTPTHLWLKLFRLIPLASVNLSRVQAMRRAGADILITYSAAEVAKWLRSP